MRSCIVGHLVPVDVGRCIAKLREVVSVGIQLGVGSRTVCGMLVSDLATLSSSRRVASLRQSPWHRQGIAAGCGGAPRNPYAGGGDVEVVLSSSVAVMLPSMTWVARSVSR